MPAENKNSQSNVLPVDLSGDIPQYTRFPIIMKEGLKETAESAAVSNGQSLSHFISDAVEHYLVFIKYQK